MFVGSHLVDGDADLVLQEVLHGRHHPKNADGSGDSVGLSEDVVGIAGDVVAAGSCVVTHRDYNLLAVFLGKLNLVPDVFRRQGAATRRVDTQHNGFHVLVLVGFAELLDERFRVDAIIFIAFAFICSSYFILQE